MALQLELSTAKATKALQNFDKALAQSQKKMQAFNDALSKAGAASSSFGSGLSKASQGLKNVSGAAGRAATATGAYANSARSAAASTKGLSGAMGLAKSTLLGFGVALGGMGIASMTKDVFQSVTAMQQLKGQLDAIRPGTDAGQKGLEFVRKTARTTATDLDALTGSFKTFASNSLNSGLKLKDVEEVFEAIAISSRSMGLTTAQTKRTFMGFQQIVSKGSFSMEELRQQIGENISVLPLLAKSMNVTGGELQKMLANGEVGLENLLPLAKEMKKVYGPGLANAMKTPLAAMTLLGNAWTRIKQLFGEPFFNALTPALDRFTKSLEKAGKDGAEGMAAFGQLAGELAGGVIDVIRILSENIDLVTAALIAFGGYWVTVKTFKVAETMYGWGQAAAPAAQAMAQLAKNMMGMSGPASTLAPAVGASATSLQKFGNAAKFTLGVLGRSIIILGLMAAAYAVTMVVMGKGEQLMKEVGAVVDWLLGLFGTNSKEVAKWANEWYEYIAGLMDFSGVAKMIGDWINYIQEQYNKLDEAYSAMVEYVRTGLVNAWDAVSSAVSSVISTVNGLINSAIDTVKRWIAALKEALGLSSKAGSGGGGGGTRAPNARVGGISQNLSRTNASSRVSSAAFVGAPKFRDGGVTGPFGQSGIPAILHPNEAVIPLRNGAVPVSISSDNTVEGKLVQAINENRAMRNALGDLRQGETIDFKTKGLDEFIKYAEMIAKNTRAQRAADWDRNATQMLSSFQKLKEDKEYQGFSTSGGTMGGGNDKAYGISKGSGPSDISGQSGKYGENVKLLQRAGGGNLVTTLPGEMFNEQYYKDIRPNFDFAGNTGMGWDIPAGLSMRHYKAAFGATKMGVPVSMLPGATPGDMQHRYVSPTTSKLSDMVQTRMGVRNMSQSAAASGLAMWQAMKKEGGGNWDTSIAASYGQGARDAKNPPGMRQIKNALNANGPIERAVKAGQTLEQFLDSKGVTEKMRVTGGGYARDPRYELYGKMWADAVKKFKYVADYVQGGSMGLGEMSDGTIKGANGQTIQGSASSKWGMENKINVGGLARGTANTSNDPVFRKAPSAGDGRGGRMVAIHPDEAVIPLRNGKVPIDMGSRAMGQGGGMAETTRSGSGGGVTVNMTINTNDVEGFRRNKKQIMQDMTIELQRAASELGTPTGEDLTKIRNAPPRRY